MNLIEKFHLLLDLNNISLLTKVYAFYLNEE